MSWRLLVLAAVFGAANSIGVNHPRLGSGGIRLQATQESRTGAISGTVQDRQAQLALRGVRVTLSRPGFPSEAFVTDEFGRFVFTELTPGDYSLTAVMPGFEPGRYGAAVMGSLGSRIVVGDGQWVRPLVVELERLAAVSGKVVDDRGAPVVGAIVRVLRRMDIGGVERLAAGPASRTNDRGEYRVSKLTPGSYLVTVPFVSHSMPLSATLAEVEGVTADRLAQLDNQAARSGQLPSRRSTGAVVDGGSALLVGAYTTPPSPVNGRYSTYPTLFFPGVLLASSALPLELEGGSDLPGIDFTLCPVKTVHVAGRVTGPRRQFTGVVLRLVPTGLEDLGTGCETATTTVEPDGAFTFVGVPAGTYTLMAPGATAELAMRGASALPATPGMGRSGSGASGGLVATLPGVVYNSLTPTTILDEHAGYARMPLEVRTSDIFDLVVPLEPTAALRGRVVYEDTGGPVRGASIELAPANAAPGLGIHLVPTSLAAESSGGTDGFTMPVIVPGEYAVRVVGLSDATIKSIVLDGRDCSRSPLTLTSGQDGQLVVTVTRRTISVTGVVRDVRRVNRAPACVIAIPTDARLWTDYGFTPTWIRTAVVASDGSYRLVGLRAGEYHLVAVSAQMSNAWSDPEFLRLATARLQRPLVLRWGDAVVLDITMTGDR